MDPFLSNLKTSLLEVFSLLNAYRVRTNVQKSIKRADKALESLVREVSTLDNAEPLAQNQKSILYDRFLDIERVPEVPNPYFCISFYKTALKIKPDSKYAWRRLAESYALTGNYDSAISAWQKFSQKNKTESSTDIAIAYTQDLAETEHQFLLDFKTILYNDLAGVFAGNPFSSPDQNNDKQQVNASDMKEYFENYLSDEPHHLVHQIRSLKDPELSRKLARILIMRMEKAKPKKYNFSPDHFITAYDLREKIEGKTVCLVANSGALVSSNAGDFIDSHDLVVRFNSFVISAEDTGQKTDVHVMIHKHSFNVELFVPIRIVFGNHLGQWARVVRRLDPKKQNMVGDETLRYPFYDKRLCNRSANDLNGAPSTGFNFMRLLYLFSNFRELNLVGFDGYNSGMYRLESAMALPKAGIHNINAEWDWISKNTEYQTPLIRSVHKLDPCHGQWEKDGYNG